jgi:hypothetical protein
MANWSLREAQASDRLARRDETARNAADLCAAANNYSAGCSDSRLGGGFFAGFVITMRTREAGRQQEGEQTALVVRNRREEGNVTTRRRGVSIAIALRNAKPLTGRNMTIATIVRSICVQRGISTRS